ncbi:MAG: nuclear transport factor 2 family protein [Polyangiaceae bacterium]
MRTPTPRFSILANAVLLAYALGAASCAASTTKGTNPASSTPPTSSTLCAADVATSTSAPVDRIGAFDGAREVREWVAMWNSYDLDQVDSLFVRDARVSYFSSEKPGLIAGIDALKEHHKGFGFAPGGADKGSRLWLEAVHAETWGRAVVVTATWFFERANAKKPPQRGPVTLVLTNDGARCRIAHAHFANDPPPKAPPNGAPSQ